MSKFEKKLNEWVSLGFINNDQALKIQSYENSKPEGAWILSGLLILGVIIIGIGIISLIAANWITIPDAVKLGVDFGLLITLAFATVKSWEPKDSSKHPLRFESFLLLFLIHCLASIGLISQIYHTGGKLYQALMLWSIITFLATLCARQIFVPFLWTAAFLFSFVFTCMESYTLSNFMQKDFKSIFMMTPLICASLTLLSKKIVGELGPTRAFRYWTVIAGLFSVMDTGALTTKNHVAIDNWFNAYAGSYALAAVVAAGIWKNKDYKQLQKIILLTLLGIFLILSHLSLLNVTAPIIYAVFTILILGLLSVFLASQQERRFFQIILIFIGIKFVDLYFKALGGLATTGFGLIFSGILILGMALLWNKQRVSLANWIETWINRQNNQSEKQIKNS